KAFGDLHTRPTGILAWGLPVPTRCQLDREGNGARRTCYFDQGRIEQRVIRWEPPARMELAVIESDLPVLPFRFTGAGYTLTAQASATEVVRTTSLRSRLAPAWFFRPLERQVVDAEHRHLLRDLAQR